MAYDLDIVRGADFNLILNLTGSNSNPLNLSGCAVSGFIKMNYSDISGYLANLNLSVINQTSGIITTNIPATGTQVMPVGYGFYDISLYNSGAMTTQKILWGKVSICPDITY